MSEPLNSNKEGLVRIMCSQDSGHFDVKISKNDERFIDLISNGCFVCKSRLSIEAVDFPKINRETKSTKTRVEKTQIKERRGEITRISKGKPISPWERMDEVIALNQEDWRDEYEEEEPYISAHISQLLPIKAICVLIADTISVKTKNFIKNNSKKKVNNPMIEIASKLDGQSWKYNKIVDNWLTVLRLQRYCLYKNENENGLTQRGVRPSAGFPAHRDEESKKFLGAHEFERKVFEEKSSKRFLNTVIGHKNTDNGGSSSGALFALGFIKFRVEKRGERYLLYIGLTEKGAEFAKIKNPLLVELFAKGTEITGGNLENKFSDTETKFFLKHCKENLPKEYECLITSINYMKNSDEGFLHVKDITEDLNLSISFIAEMKEQGNPLPRRAFTSSLLNRWVGMNILIRQGRGIYTWNKKHENLYEKDVETSGYLEIESSSTTNDMISKKENQNISRPWLD